MHGLMCVCPGTESDASPKAAQRAALMFFNVFFLMAVYDSDDFY